MDEASSSETLLPFAALTLRAYDKTISICLYVYIYIMCLFLGGGGVWVWCFLQQSYKTWSSAIYGQGFWGLGIFGRCPRSMQIMQGSNHEDRQEGPMVLETSSQMLHRTPQSLNPKP